MPRFFASFFVALALFLLACNQQGGGASVSSEIKDFFRPDQSVPFFEIPDLSGKLVSSRDLQGKFVVLNFWATWCAPCVAEMPALQRFYQHFKDKGVEVVAVNVDTAKKEGDVRKFVAEKGLGFTILLDHQSGLPVRFGVTGFPETLFISPDGKFRAITDPESKKRSLRLISDRPWDAPEYIEAFEKVLLER